MKTKQTKQMLLRLCVVVALGWLLKSKPAVAAEHAIPPFVAEGRLLTQEFRTDTNLNYRTDASVVFLYSNGWWQVEARCKYVNQGNIIVHNCMKIPDGTRSYIIFEGTELQLKVIESTNLHGITFPIRVVCKRFTPNWGGKNRDDLRVGLQSELTVTRISFSEKDAARRIAAPYEMLAEDARLAFGVTYLVHDDQWKPVSDPEIQRRARFARQRAGSSE